MREQFSAYKHLRKRSDKRKELLKYPTEQRENSLKFPEKLEKPLDYFSGNEVLMLIYSLLELDTDARAKNLGITQELYFDKEKSRDWRNSIQKKIHPDKLAIKSNPSLTEKATEAVVKLEKIYKRMIK